MKIDEAMKASMYDAAVATKTIDHEGKKKRIDIVVYRTGAVRALWHGVALALPRYAPSAKEIDDPALSWRPY